MTIKVGDSIPAMTLVKATADGPAPVTTADLFGGRSVALFSVPGAFTPTCSARHLPGYVEHAETFLRNGVDEVVCVSVNDAFVMAAWGKSAHADGSAYGMGIRGQRFSMIVRDGKVAELNIEPPGAFGVSSAEHLLGQLA